MLSTGAAIGTVTMNWRRMIGAPRIRSRRGYWIAAGIAAVIILALVMVINPPPLNGYGVDRSAEASRDCAACPQMIVIPSGEYVMGSERLYFDRWLAADAAPRRSISIQRRFAVSLYEITFAQWDACVADGGCAGYTPPDDGWGRDNRPVIHVSWRDAHAYVAWLSEKTGSRYRLLSEAEWEYAARAGSNTPYPWGNWAGHRWANYGQQDCEPCRGRVDGADRWESTAPVGQFPPNRFGLYDMQGNVYEWTEDCYENSYVGAPTDGAPRIQENCARHVLRGAAWYSDPGRIRSSYRAWQQPDQRDHVIGFRVAKEMPV